MVCIYCGSSTQVTNSRPQKRLNQIWRRRRCTACGSIFTTHELLELSSGIVLEGGSGRLQPFSRDTLFVSIYECCKHRPGAVEDAAALTRTSLSFLQLQVTEGRLQREQVLTSVLTVLERFDKVAATMYKAYHPPKPMS
jgi:transcriptional regulator NrdR family protein